MAKYPNAPNSLGNTCETCGYYTNKLCQLNPRQPIVYADGEVDYLYPEMNKYEWCSHWQPVRDNSNLEGES